MYKPDHTHVRMNQYGIHGLHTCQLKLKERTNASLVGWRDETMKVMDLKIGIPSKLGTRNSEKFRIWRSIRRCRTNPLGRISEALLMRFGIRTH